ncbi:MAG: hypothetical protein IPK88_14840 [Saprospiraceae bacterium]|nr:hypothetical protein [Candidatus Defluviibacterium haderslevense]
MKDTKVYHFLSGLTKTELNRLSKYLESPYFNRNEILLTIYYQLEQHFRNNSSTELTTTGIWNQIYPQTPYHGDRFRKLCSELMDLCESFLAQQVYDNNPLHKANYLLQAIHHKQIERMYTSATNSARNLSKRQFFKPASYYYYLYEIEKNLYKLENVELNRASKKNIEKINLEKIVSNLDYFYISEKLKYYCSLLSWNKIIALDKNLLFIQEIIQIARSAEFIDIPPIAIYLKIQDTLIDSENENHYFELKHLIEKYIDLFPLDEAKDIMDNAINYSIQRINKKDSTYLKELFELYQKSIDSEIIIVNDEITPWTFKNIISTALRLNEYNWTQNFINQYGDKINKLYQQNAVNFGLAMVFFSKKEFGKTISLLNKLEYDEIYFSLDAKVLILSTYYELDEFMVLSSFFESFKNYLTRNKNVSQSNKIRYLNLIKYTKKLVESSQYSKIKLLKLKEDIKADSSYGKNWLLEKVDELIAIAKPEKVKN